MGNILFYIGTNTSKSSKGIYGISMNPITKEFTAPELFAETICSNYLAINNSRTVLYAACGAIDGSYGLVTAYAIDPVTGWLKKINEVQAPGKGLCHISLDSADSYLFVVSYQDATVQVYPLMEDGSIGTMTWMEQHFGNGADPNRQEKAHAHMTCLTPDEGYLCVCDLGLDQIVVYRFFKETGKLERDDQMTFSLPPGSGSRHMVFHPNGKIAYVVSELSSRIFVLSYHSGKRFAMIQAVNALQEESIRSIAAAIRISGDGQYLYTSNRGEDSISLFHVASQTGLLRHISNTSAHGKHPRDFILDSTGSLLLCANRDTDNLVVYQVSDENGALTQKNEITGISMPICISEFPLL